MTTNKQALYVSKQTTIKIKMVKSYNIVKCKKQRSKVKRSKEKLELWKIHNKRRKEKLLMEYNEVRKRKHESIPDISSCIKKNIPMKNAMDYIKSTENKDNAKTIIQIILSPLSFKLSNISTYSKDF